MTLADLLKKIDDEQQIALCSEDRQLKITGDEASIEAMAAPKLLLCDVDTLDVKDDVLWIWIEEAEEDA